MQGSATWEEKDERRLQTCRLGRYRQRPFFSAHHGFDNFKDSAHHGFDNFKDSATNGLDSFKGSAAHGFSSVKHGASSGLKSATNNWGKVKKKIDIKTQVKKPELEFK